MWYWWTFLKEISKVEFRSMKFSSYFHISWFWISSLHVSVQKNFKNMNQINEIQTRIIDHRYRLDQVNYNFVPNHLPKIIDLDFPLPKQKIKNKHSYSIRHSYPHLVCFFNKCSTLRVQLCIQSSRTKMKFSTLSLSLPPLLILLF